MVNGCDNVEGADTVPDASGVRRRAARSRVAGSDASGLCVTLIEKKCTSDGPAPCR